MTKHYAALEVKTMRGEMVLVGLAKTPRGQKYIKGAVPIGASSFHDKEFKQKLAAAVAKLTAEAG